MRMAIAFFAMMAAMCSTASASTIDFTDGVFESVRLSDTPGRPLTLSESADGVTFFFTAIENLSNVNRMVPTGNGLRLGGDGGSTTAFLMVVDHEVSLDDYSTNSDGSFRGSPSFDLIAGGFGGEVISSDNPLTFSIEPRIFNDRPINLLGWTAYLFSLDGVGPNVESYLTSISFTKLEPVPIPASLPLFGSALLILFVTRRRRRR